MLYYYGSWVERASCRNHESADPDVWFDDPTRARGICMKCPVKDNCLFTALELIQRGEPVKGIWGGLSAVQLRRALEKPESIPKMRGQRSRAKVPPVFLVPLIPEPLIPRKKEPEPEPVAVPQQRERRDEPMVVRPAATIPVEVFYPLPSMRVEIYALTPASTVTNAQATAVYTSTIDAPRKPSTQDFHSSSISTPL